MEAPVISLKDISAPYCDICKAMIKKAMEKRWSHVFGPSRIHHETAKEFLMAAASGCGICVQMKQESNVGKHAIAGYQRGGRRHYSSFKITTGLSLSFSNGATMFLVRNHISKQDAGEFKAHRSIFNENTGSPEVLRQASSWLSRCSQQHSDCGKERDPSYYPPRILLVHEDSVKLLDTKDARPSGPYATLSYCWGRNPRHLTLTELNLDRLQLGIKISQLAKTFQDAIIIAKSLDISLLWIDSLCILQSGAGAEADWRKHIFEMSNIYFNCLLNIAADHGESADDGCFSNRDPDFVKPCVIDYHLDTRTSSDTDTDGDLLYAFNFWENNLGYTPLSHRAWVHQERLLSPRIIHFGEMQLFWECSQLRACETFPIGVHERMYTNKVPFSLHEQDRDQWIKIVEAFSRASLTKAQDKLVAIAGVAERIGRVSKAAYVAGLFENTLIVSLFWRSSNGSKEDLIRIMEPYRAPSWSWASCDGNIKFLHIGAVESICSIDEIKLNYVDPSNPFGQLKAGGFLRISACVWKLSADQMKSEIHTRYTGNLISDETGASFHDMSNNKTVHLFFDESPLAQDRSGAVLIILIGTRSWLWGLIVVPVQQEADPPSWLRIGIFSASIFDRDRLKVKECPKTTLRII
jgi:hypothetical protein